MDDPEKTLFSLLERLSQARISHSLSINRDNAVTINAAVPGQRWEIDVHEDGEIDLEIFQSDGKLHGLQELFTEIEKHSDE